MKKHIVIILAIMIMALSSCVTAPTKHQVGMALIDIGSTAVAIHNHWGFWSLF